MSPFLTICIGAFCAAFSSAIAKLTQRNLGIDGLGIEVNMFIIVECGVIGSVFLYCFNGAVPIRFTMFTFIMATLSTVLSNAGAPFIYLALASGDISSMKIITTVGSMLLPYLFGIVILKEATTALAVCGVIILLCAIIIPVLIEKTDKSLSSKDRNSIKFYIYCCVCCVFSSGGIIVNKLYWTIGGYEKNTVQEFSFLSYLMGAVVAGIVLAYFLIIKKRRLILKGEKGSWYVPLINGFNSIISAFAYYLGIKCIKTLPASVYNPLNTGLTLIATAVMAWLVFKEKLSKIRIISILATVLAVWLINS